MGSLGLLRPSLFNISRNSFPWISKPYITTCHGFFRLNITTDVNLKPLFIRNLGSFSAFSTFSCSSQKNLFDLKKAEVGFSHNLGLLGHKSSLPGLSIITRGKKSKRRKEPVKEEAEFSDDDGEADDLGEEETGSDFKDIKTMVSSLRLDVILKAGLNISRNKLDASFYESKIRVNEKKVLKKSRELEEGDEIDIIKEPSSVNPDLLNISRIVILKVGEYDDDSDKKPVKLRRFKNLLVKKYDDHNKED